MFVITLKKALALRVPSPKISKCKSAGIHAEVAEKCFEKPPFLCVYFFLYSCAKKTLPSRVIFMFLNAVSIEYPNKGHVRTLFHRRAQR
jgi:hypothetical protein